MISQALRVMLLTGLVIFPAVASGVIGIPAGAPIFNSGPIICGPGPDCG